MSDPIAPGERLVPGGLVAVPGFGATRRITTSFTCREEVGGDVARWTWAFLEGGDLLEVAPRGTFLYDAHRVAERGTPLAQELVSPGGALLRFEARVRAGTALMEPTILTIAGREYRVACTGTAAVERDGPPPSLGAWDALSDDPKENAYFALEALDGATVVLGLWTRAVCLSFGRRLTPTASTP